MPAKVKVKIISGRNLPVMDRSSDTTDAYVEIKLASTTYKTDVCRKSLHPHWNSEWYRFEVDDAELQDEPLQIRLMDYDTYSANDAIGKVYVDLNPLLLPAAGLLMKYSDVTSKHEQSSNSVMSGWIPVYDTMHGIRGEVNIVVKIELFTDFNRFRQSSCGIQFFCSKSIPHGYFAQTVHGFVEELIVSDDPEYQWIDKIRTPRASNEARQTLFFKLSGELQRKIGVKAMDLGGNAVVGYCQSFDLEGESGIVARGIGTAVTLVKLIDVPHSNLNEPLNEERAQSYLKFLGSEAGFRLNSSPGVIPQSTNPFTPSPLLVNLPVLDLDHPRYKNLPKHLYNTEFHKQLRSTRSNPALNETRPHPSVKTLLKQEDMRGTPGYGISQKFKNFKYTSQNILSKKMTALKAKLGDAGIEELDSDTSSIKSGETPNKKKRSFKFKRTVSDSSVMAELLARSVLHAQNSLTCILESQDSISSSPYEDDDGDNIKTDLDIIPNTIQELAPVTDLLEKTASEPLLSVHHSGLLETPSSNNSSSTSESVSSDDEDEDDDDDSKESNFNFETVSNIVKNVEMLEQTYNHKLFSKQLLLPVANQEIEDNPFIYPTSQDDVILKIDDVEINNQDINRDDSSTKAPLAIFEFDNTYSDQELDIDSNHTHKTIIPPVMIEGKIKQKSLVKTAMQTILLEKLSIIGTYTPPISPTSVTTPSSVFNVASRTSSTNSILDSEISFATPFQAKLPRSSTALSLDEASRSRETVLGTPFMSMYNIRRRQSNPCLSQNVVPNNLERSLRNFKIFKQRLTCFSDSELNKSDAAKIFPFNATTSHKKNYLSHDNIHKHKFTFASLIGRSHSHNDENLNNSQLKRGFSHEHLEKRKFSFLHLSRRQSHEPETNLKKVKSDELHKSRFPFLKRHRKSSENDSDTHKSRHSIISSIFFHKHEDDDDKATFKKHGLLGTALGNVVMETVQDILATSQADQKSKDADVDKNKNPVRPSSPILTINTNQDPDVSLVPINTKIESGTSFSDNNRHASLTPSIRNNSSPIPDSQTVEHGHHRTESVGTKMMQSPAKLNSVPCIYRRSSDSDLSITPKGSSLTGSDRSAGMNGHVLNKTTILFRATLPQDNFDMLEYPFLTMSKFPPGFILQLGGAVSARSVKLLERISNLEEPESRDTWWSEIRMEIRSHARALNCNAVLAYTETTSICEDVCVLSASGTAAVIGFHYTGEMGEVSKPLVINKEESDKDKHKTQQEKKKVLVDSPEHEVFFNHINSSCSLCHLPYNTNNVPIRSTVLKCRTCRTGKVPDVLIATIETPDGVPTLGRGCFIQSFVCRQLKDLRGESNAKEISDGLPFLEYELHRLLVNKLKIKGMNAIFGLKIRISIGEKMLVGLATGTAIFMTPLPTPVLPKLVSDRSSDEKKLADLQKLLNETVKKNREIYQLKIVDDNQNGRILSDDDSEDEHSVIDLSLGNKDCCILEVDDPEDAEVVNMLMEERPPDGFHVVNTEFVPGLEELEIVKNLQMFTQIYRAKFQAPYSFDVHFHRLLQSVYFKLRRMVPCALCNLQFRVGLPETDEIQLCVVGIALGLGDPNKMKYKRKTAGNKKEEDLIFNLEEDQIPENSVTHLTTAHPTSRLRQKSPLRSRIQTIKQRHMPYHERHGVDITPLSYVPGGKIEQYLGHLNFFFIRETTSIREEGGLSGFIHSFVTEVLAIVRAHVTALGGNAMVAYFITECVLNHNLHKNQGQCLINVGGDVVFVSYFKEET